LGRRASWIGVSGVAKAEVLERLGLVETGEVAFEASAPLCCATLPSGWTIILSDRFEFGAGPTLARLPAAAAAVACQVWDVISSSEACGFNGGRETWRVAFDPSQEPAFRAKGDLPPPFAALREAALEREARENPEDRVSHLVEVPLSLTEAICGFRPDEGSVPIDTVFRTVEPRRSGAGGKRQDADLSLYAALEQRVQTNLLPLVRAHGFEPVASHPDHHHLYPMGAPYTFVRLGGSLSETIWVRWTLHRDAPAIYFHFAVRRGATPRPDVPAGWAGTSSDRPPLLARLLGRKAAPSPIDSVIEEGRLLVGAIDRHLREGEPHPQIRPTRPLDEAAGD